MKTCSQCGKEKPLDQFYKYSKGLFGRRASCKACCAIAYGEKWRQNAKQWARNNSERNRARVREWQRSDPAVKAAGMARLKAWLDQNQDRWAAVDHHHCRARYARKLMAMPQWANKQAIKEIYAAARQRTKATGVKWQVDHIVPLRSRFVCGLHVESNLQIIEGIANSKKGNWHWPDMP